MCANFLKSQSRCQRLFSLFFTFFQKGAFHGSDCPNLPHPPRFVKPFFQVFFIQNPNMPFQTQISQIQPLAITNRISPRRGKPQPNLDPFPFLFKKSPSASIWVNLRAKKLHKCLSMRSLRSFAAKIVLKLHDFGLLAAQLRKCLYISYL